MSPKAKKALVVTGAVVVAVGALRSWYYSDRARESYERSASDVDAASPRLLFRVDRTAHAEGCEGQAAQVFVGLDSNRNEQLEQAEQAGVPMTLCSVDSIEGRIEQTPPNAYCPRPGAMVVLQHPDQRADTHAEFIVCFDPTRRTIESTYTVYAAK